MGYRVRQPLEGSGRACNVTRLSGVYKNLKDGINLLNERGTYLVAMESMSLMFFGRTDVAGL